MTERLEAARRRLDEHGQSHLLRFVDDLSSDEVLALLDDIESIDYALFNRLIRDWIERQPEPESYESIEPVPTFPVYDPANPVVQEAVEAGEQAIREGNVGVFLVAGGQGTRLGFDGPKGAYPIGPVTGRTIFEYHSEKILAEQRHYDTTIPFYIMVSEANEEATRTFFEDRNYFGLEPENIMFVRQRMIPCVDENGKFILASKCGLAKNPNGHGGAIETMVEKGVTKDARSRGVKYLTYFQVDNCGVKVTDPYFVGVHVLQNAEMSSKVHRKGFAREPVGVHCLCDGRHQIIEYTELDIYPQLLKSDDKGGLIYYAGNPAMHVFSIDFVERVHRHFDDFPWHCSHKKIPFVDESGNLVEPGEPNGYKFETFIFDALRFTNHGPVAVEITFAGEYAPVKLAEGFNSVVTSRRDMTAYWAGWLDAAGSPVPRDDDGNPTIDVEISALFARNQDEFVEASKGKTWPVDDSIAILANGEIVQGRVGSGAGR